MLYVVITYITIGLIALVFLPEHVNPRPKYTKTIFDRDEKINTESDEIEKVVEELLKDV